METVRLTDQQSPRIANNGRLTSAAVAATPGVADRRAIQGTRPAARFTEIDTPPHSDNLILRLRQLEGTTQAVLATLRRSLIEGVPPTRAGLAHEAAIVFGLKDDQRALDVIDDVAQTVGIAGLT